MIIFKISLLTLIIFGIAHFLADYLLVRWMALNTYLTVKYWIGKITIALTIIVIGSVLWMLIKFLLQ